MRTTSHFTQRKRAQQRGFTLPEILIALSIISLITVVTLGAIGPWLDFRQKLETERKLNEVREGLSSYYRNNAFTLESVAANTLGPFVESTVNAEGVCNSQGPAFSELGFSLSDSGDKAAIDGFGNAFCVFITPQRTRALDGTSLFYRTVAIVSTGSNGRLDPDTRLNPTTDALEVGGDDTGVTVSGLDIQQDKYHATVRRLERVVDMYETYFTTRFLQAADRDISRYYFSRMYDASGAVDSQANMYVPVFPSMQNIGVSPDLGKTAWEAENDILFNNHSAASLGAGIPVPRTPATTGITALPYTAVIAARVPGPAVQYIVRVAVGNY